MVKTTTKSLILRKIPKNQLKILEKLACETTSQRKLARELNIDEASMSRSMQRLESKELVKNTSWKERKNNNEKIWKITKTGIKEILLNSDSKNFWRLLIIIYDPKNINYKEAPSIDEIIKEFEEKNIQVAREDVLPYDHDIIEHEFYAVSHNYPNIISNTWFILLDIIGNGPPISFENIENVLKKHYPKIYRAFKGIDKSNYAEWYRPLHKGLELQKEINELKRYKLIQKIKTNKTRFQLSYHGFLLYVYFLTENLEVNKYGVSVKKLQEGFENIKNLSRREKLLKSRLKSVIKFNKNLFPAIFHYNDRLKISDYYIVMILVLIHFPIHRDFFDDEKLEKYVILKKIQNRVLKKDKEKFTKYFSEMNEALFELIKERKEQYSFVSDLSEEFFEKIKKENMKRYEKYRKNWEKKSEQLRRSKKSWERNSADDHQKHMPKWEFSGYEYVKEILNKATWMVQYNDGIYQDKSDPAWKKILPSKKDMDVINRVLDIMLRKYIISNELTKEFTRNYWSGQFDDKYINYQKNVENKIIFDFYLLYRFLEPEKWENNFHENESIKKWHNSKVKKLWIECERIAKEENMIKHA